MALMTHETPMVRVKLDCGHVHLVRTDATCAWCTWCGGTMTVERPEKG